jgi:hypothetical protein
MNKLSAKLLAKNIESGLWIYSLAGKSISRTLAAIAHKPPHKYIKLFDSMSNFCHFNWEDAAVSITFNVQTCLSHHLFYQLVEFRTYFIW